MAVALVSLASLSCGRKVSTGLETESTDFASRLSIPPTKEEVAGDVALCNKSVTDYLTARLMVFYDPTNNYHPELLRLHIPTIDPEFAKSNYRIVLRKWKAYLDGTTFQDDTPLKFRIERISTRTPITSTFDLSSLHWVTLAGRLPTNNGEAFSMETAFEEFSFVVDLKDSDASFDALKFSLYKDGTWVEDLNMLIPAFYADPAKYALEQNSVLAKLHPFYATTSSSTAKDYFKAACF
jgi:hypothetical protein